MFKNNKNHCISIFASSILEGMPNLATACVALLLAYGAHWLAGATMIGVVSASGIVATMQVQSQEGIRISLNEQKAHLGGASPRCSETYHTSPRRRNGGWRRGRRR